MKYFPLYASFFLLNAQNISAVMKQNALKSHNTETFQVGKQRQKQAKEVAEGQSGG